MLNLSSSLRGTKGCRFNALIRRLVDGEVVDRLVEGMVETVEGMVETVEEG